MASNGSVPVFEPGADGGWLVAIPAPEGMKSAAGVALDVSDSVLLVSFPGGSTVQLDWPRDALPSQLAAASARFSKRRAQLLVSLPFAGTTPAPAEPVLQGIFAGQVSSPNAKPELATTPCEPEPVNTVTEIEEPTHVNEAAVALLGGGDLISDRVDAFKQRLENSPEVQTACKSLFEQKPRAKELPKSEMDETLEFAGAIMMHSAASLGETEKVRRFLEAGIDPNFEDELSATPLEKAVMSGSVTTVEVLIAAKANVQGAFGAPSTPLHRAVAIGGPEGYLLLQLLLSRGANQKKKDHSGRTALELARDLRVHTPPELHG